MTYGISTHVREASLKCEWYFGCQCNVNECNAINEVVIKKIE